MVQASCNLYNLYLLIVIKIVNSHEAVDCVSIFRNFGWDHHPYRQPISQHREKSSPQTESTSYVRRVNAPSWSSSVPFDFVQAAQKATPSVVNITAKIAANQS